MDYLHIDYREIKKIVGRVKSTGRTILGAKDSLKILDHSNIPHPDGTVVNGLDGCLKTAESIGFPVVLKVASPDISHKDQAAGVVLDIGNEDELRESFEEIQRDVKENEPDAEIEGFYVSEYIEGGEELIIGGTIDDSFGPVVVFGRGGVDVEAKKDVVFRIAPLEEDETREMIDEFYEERGLSKPDSQIEDVVEIVRRVSKLISDVDFFEEIDLNPVIVTEEGAAAVDALFKIR